MAHAAPYDAIVLDVMLPGADGFEVCRQLRAHGVWTPMLMLTARDGVEDRVAGLDAGADDYLVEAVRVRGAARAGRALSGVRRPRGPTVLEVGELRLDPAARRAWRGDAELDLSREGVRAARAVPARAGHVLSRDPNCSTARGTSRSSGARTSRRLRGLPARQDRPALRALVDRDGARRRLPLPGAGVSRLPIRSSPDAAFGIVMAVVLAAMGVFVYLRVGSRCSRPVDQTLRSQSAEAVSNVERGERRSPTATSPAARRWRSCSRWTAAWSARPARAAALLRPTDVAQVDGRRAAAPLDLAARPEGDWRLFAVQPRGTRSVVVVARSLEPREETLSRLSASCCSPPARAPARVARGLRPRGRRAASGRGDAPACRGGLRRRPARLPVPRAATRSRGSPRRSTRCSTGWRPRSSTSGASSRTRATSCERRSRCCARSSSSRSGGRGSPEELRGDAPFGGRGDRPAVTARRGSAADRARAMAAALPLRRERCGSPRSSTRVAARFARAARSSRAHAARRRPTDAVGRRGSRTARAGARQPRRRMRSPTAPASIELFARTNEGDGRAARRRRRPGLPAGVPRPRLRSLQPRG